MIPALALAQGTLEYPCFYSDILGRDMCMGVYLPHDYDPSGSARYPVVYYLHGAFANHTSYWVYLRQALDQLITAGEIDPMVVVAPDGSAGEFGGSFWANSQLYGRFEDYVVDEVVPFVDTRYLTLASFGKRGLAGFSMGGTGTFTIGLRHTDLFSAFAARSGYASWDRFREAWRDAVLAENGAPPYNYDPSAGAVTNAMFLVAAAYTPDLDNPPYFVDLPLDENGTIIEDVLDRWKAHNADSLVLQLSPEDYPDIQFSCGQLDGLALVQNLDVAAAFDGIGVPYVFEPHGGGHILNIALVKEDFRFLDGALNAPAYVDDLQASMKRPMVTVSAQPNPARQHVEFVIDVREPISSGRIELFDVSGRRVRKVDLGDLTQGVHQIAWDGLMDGGMRIDSGCYYFCLRDEVGRRPGGIVTILP
jgi:S-formylglutathione hydrolase FrmB